MSIRRILLVDVEFDRSHDAGGAQLQTRWTHHPLGEELGVSLPRIGLQERVHAQLKARKLCLGQGTLQGIRQTGYGWQNEIRSCKTYNSPGNNKAEEQLPHCVREALWGRRSRHRGRGRWLRQPGPHAIRRV